MIRGGFVIDTLDETIADLKIDASCDQEEILRTIIKPIIPTNKVVAFWMGVLQSALAVSALLSLLLLMIYASKVGFIDAIETIFNINVESKTTVKK